MWGRLPTGPTHVADSLRESKRHSRRECPTNGRQKGIPMPDQPKRKALPLILDRLHATYANPRYELNWQNPLQLLVATILAAQCTDERVNAVTRTLFPKYPDAAAYANADFETLAADVRP